MILSRDMRWKELDVKIEEDRKNNNQLWYQNFVYAVPAPRVNSLKCPIANFPITPSNSSSAPDNVKVHQFNMRIASKISTVLSTPLSTTNS